jgi:hypothetical protein
MLVVQVAFAIVLVFGAAIATRAFVGVLRQPLGFQTENVATINVPMPRGTTDIPAFYRRVLDVVVRRPDVLAAGATGSAPLSGAAHWSSVKRPGSVGRAAGSIHVMPGYFEALGIDLIRGRTLTWDDVGSGGVVLSESAAHMLFPNEEPLGQTLDSGEGTTWRVVGIVRDVRQTVERDLGPTVYAIPTGRTTGMSVFAKLAARHDAALADIRRDVGVAVAGSPVTVAWWNDWIADLTSYKNPRFQTLVLTSFAGIALALTALGVFGVVAFLVASRTREMGIRAAIGASGGSLVALIVRQTMWPVAIGLVLGLVTTRGIAKLAEAQLFKVETNDPLTLALAALAVVLAAALAAYLPARRAARVDPLIVLRAE